MKIAPGTVVTLDYDICTADGEIVESSQIDGPVTFVYGRGAIIPGLDAALVGMSEGEERSFTFSPEQAFGRREDAPRKVIKRSEFPPDAVVAKGAQFEAGLPGNQRICLDVVDVTAEEVTVRLVHPLAGKSVTMHASVRKIREATPAERESGKVQHVPPPPPKG